MHARTNELGVPPSLYSDEQARELARIWSTGNGQVFILNVHEWDEPAAWGLLLVDFARQAASAYAQASNNWTEEEALAQIKQLFDAEWFHRTD